jgi:hypothetical protein
MRTFALEQLDIISTTPCKLEKSFFQISSLFLISFAFLWRHCKLENDPFVIILHSMKDKR